MVDILFKYPTRSRPELFLKTLGIYCDFLSGDYSYKFLISCDADDESMNNPAMIKKIKDIPNTELHFNPPIQTKISAVNSNLSGQEFKILFLISDDMIPAKRDYDKIVIRDMEKHFGYDQFGALHYNDGRVGNALNTLSIMNKKMYDYFGYIYHPSYISLWCDNEYTDITRIMGTVKYIDEIIIVHKWIDVIGGADKLLKRNDTFFNQDNINYNARRKQGFPRINPKLKNYYSTDKVKKNIDKIGLICMSKVVSPPPVDVVVTTEKYAHQFSEIETHIIQEENPNIIFKKAIDLLSESCDLIVWLQDVQESKENWFQILLDLHKLFPTSVVTGADDGQSSFEVFSSYEVKNTLSYKNVLFSKELCPLVYKSVCNTQWTFELAKDLEEKGIAIIFSEVLK